MSYKGNSKRTVAVDVKERLSEAQVAAIGRRLHADAEKFTDRTYVNFDVSGEPPPEHMAHWATVEFDPNIRVLMWGVTP